MSLCESEFAFMSKSNYFWLGFTPFINVIPHEKKLTLLQLKQVRINEIVNRNIDSLTPLLELKHDHETTRIYYAVTSLCECFLNHNLRFLIPMHITQWYSEINKFYAPGFYKQDHK